MALPDACVDCCLDACGLCPSLLRCTPDTPTWHSGGQCPGDSLPLDSCTVGWRWWRWYRIHSDFWSVHCPLSVNKSPWNPNHVFNHLSVPRVLLLQTSDFASSEHSIERTNEALRTVGVHPVQWVLLKLVLPAPSR